MKKKLKIIKAANALNKVTEVAQKMASKYPICECFNIIKNMYTAPDYTQLVIEQRAWIKLMCFIHLIGDYEISGFGRIVDGRVVDFDILKQEVRGAYVEASDDAVIDFIRRTPADQRGEWILDWHSHVEMGTTPSGTDWTNYEDMLKARMGKQFPFMIVNKKQSVTCMQYISEQRHPDISIVLSIKEDVSESDMLAIYNECKEKVELLCKKYEAPVTTYVPSYINPKQATTWPHYQRNNRVDDYNDYYGWGNRYGEWDDDDEVAEAKRQGFVFDDELEYCSECGKVLDLEDPDQQTWGVCAECLGKVLPGSTEK